MTVNRENQEISEKVEMLSSILVCLQRLLSSDGVSKKDLNNIIGSALNISNEIHVKLEVNNENMAYDKCINKNIKTHNKIIISESYLSK
ncbi:hypothetical protein [Photorhabdus temperata]|uniref:hypothetical protein n=1 Tax=Photorhabdus temperata TaxID=574560 RepID=UPI00038A1A49|nr:hypothetical protein [Photorhabdus temperata]EQB98777.1 hypothetical protein B738_22280 [Photorhabdus temperata subsp. temperata M1021]